MAFSKPSYNESMVFYPTLTAYTAARLSLMAGADVVDRKLMGLAGLHQPAAHS